MRKFSLVLVLIMVVFTACQHNDNASNQEVLKSQIMVLQKNLMKNFDRIDPVQADSMIVLYKEYANDFPDDSISADYLYRAAGVEMGLERNEACIQTLSLIEKRYSKSDLMPTVLQLKAFIYDTKFQDYDKAKAILNQLIEDYPNDELIPNAKAYRDMIGKDPEELFRKVDSTQALSK